MEAIEAASAWLKNPKRIKNYYHSFFVAATDAGYTAVWLYHKTSKAKYSAAYFAATAASNTLIFPRKGFAYTAADDAISNMVFSAIHSGEETSLLKKCFRKGIQLLSL